MIVNSFGVRWSPRQTDREQGGKEKYLKMNISNGIVKQIVSREIECEIEWP